MADRNLNINTRINGADQVKKGFDGINLTAKELKQRLADLTIKQQQFLESLNLTDKTAAQLSGYKTIKNEITAVQQEMVKATAANGDLSKSLNNSFSIQRSYRTGVMNLSYGLMQLDPAFGNMAFGLAALDARQIEVAASAGGLKAGLAAIGSELAGPVGLMIAIPAAISLFDAFTKGNKEAEKQALKTAAALEKEKNELDKLTKAAIQNVLQQNQEKLNQLEAQHPNIAPSYNTIGALGPGAHLTTTTTQQRFGSDYAAYDLLTKQIAIEKEALLNKGIDANLEARITANREKQKNLNDDPKSINYYKNLVAGATSLNDAYQKLNTWIKADQAVIDGHTNKIKDTSQKIVETEFQTNKSLFEMHKLNFEDYEKYLQKALTSTSGTLAERIRLHKQAYDEINKLNKEYFSEAIPVRGMNFQDEGQQSIFNKETALLKTQGITGPKAEGLAAQIAMTTQAKTDLMNNKFTMSPKRVSNFKWDDNPQIQKESKDLKAQLDQVDRIADKVGSTIYEAFSRGKNAIDEAIQSLEQYIAKMLIVNSLKAGLTSIITGGSFLSSFTKLLGFTNGGIVPKAANGMIVPGSSYSGDKILARVNSGEMILNPPQQNRLFAMLAGASQINYNANSSIPHFSGKLTMDKQNLVAEIETGASNLRFSRGITNAS